MPNLTNSEVVEHTLQALISKIGRRTSEGFAVITIDTILKELEAKYDFLKYIEVQNTSYSEGMDAVNILPDIDSVESAVFYKSLNDIIISAVRHLKRKADFFFIKEFKEVIDHIADLKIEQDGVDLSHMQLQYIVDRKQALKIDNSEVVENVISTLSILLNKLFPEKQSIKTMITSIRKLEEKYNFFKYIEIADTPDSEGLYAIKALPEINNVHIAIMAESIKKLIEEVGKSTEWKNEESFIEAFKNELGEESLSKIEKMGVNLNNIQVILLRQGHELLVKKALETIINIIDERTSKGFAVVTIDTIIEELENRHDVLKYIKIDKSRYTEGAYAISIMPEVNSVESYKLGKAIREIIKMTHKHLGDKTNFIEEFKNKLGDKYLSEIEKIGVNLHFLELKFT